MAIPLALVGLGPIGIGIGRILRDRTDARLVAAADIDPALAGRDLGEVLGGPALDVEVGRSIAEALRAAPAVTVVATGSHLPEVAPQIAEIVESGSHVVSTCEELTYPWHRYPDLAADLDRRARARGAAVIALGVNPGFVMDLLPIALTAPCPLVSAIRVERAVDAAARRLSFQRKVGVGMTREAFDAGVRAGRIGHVGLAESAAMIAAALGWRLSDVKETLEPLGDGGTVRGLHQTLVAYVAEEPVISLDLVMAAGEESRDEVWISGPLPVHVRILGGVHGDVATWAITANAAIQIAAAPPGLHTAYQVPAVRWTAPG